jgi:hypothetical protein
MAALPPPEGLTEDDYDAIHAAVVETVRGRWFLAEYARRNRVEEVREMLAAIGRLETIVTTQRALPLPDSSPHQRLLTQRADEIATRLADIIEELREGGADAYLCDELESQTRAVGALARDTAAEPRPPQPLTRAALVAETRPALEAPKELPGDVAKPAPLPPWTPAAALPPSRALAPAMETQFPPDLPNEPLKERPRPAPLPPWTPAALSPSSRPSAAEVTALPEVLKQAPEERAEPAPPLPSVSPADSPHMESALPQAAPLQVPDAGDPRLAALAALDRLSLAEKLALFS